MSKLTKIQNELENTVEILELEIQKKEIDKKIKDKKLKK